MDPLGLGVLERVFFRIRSALVGAFDVIASVASELLGSIVAVVVGAVEVWVGL